MHASNSARFNQSCHDLASSLDLPDRDVPDADIVKLIFNHLTDPANGQWLMILDNIEDFVLYPGSRSQEDETEASPQHLAAFVPEVAHGSVLITSRNRIAAESLIGGSSTILEVKPMNDSDTLALIRARSGDEKSLEEDCIALLHMLGNIPLAITQAAAYISQKAPRMSISRYLNLFSQSVKNQTELLEDNFRDLRRDPEVANALLTTWKISFRHLRERHPSSAELLGVMCYLDSQAMPESLFLPKYSNDSLQFESQFKSRVDPLISYSFISHEIGQVSFSMHRLVQLATKEWLKEHDKSEKHKHEALDIIVRAFPDASDLFQNWITAEALSPHAEVILSQLPFSMNTTQNLAMATLLSNTASHAVLKGDFNAAFVKFVRARDLQFPIFGWGDPLVAETSDLITNVLSEMGRREIAIRVQRVGIARRAASLGTSHENSHTSLRMMAKLGELLRKHERSDEAKVVIALAVEGLTKMFGPRDLQTLSALRTSALLQDHEGRIQEAEASLRHVLDTRREILGDKDLNTLTSMGDLADFYTANHQYKFALPLYATACRSLEQVFGPNHRKSLDFLGRFAHATAQSRLRRNTVLGGRLGRLLDHRKYRKFLGSSLPSVSILIGGIFISWAGIHFGLNIYEVRISFDHIDSDIES